MVDKQKKIRILHLVQGLRVGGAEVLLQYYIKAFPKRKYEHFVYYFGEDGPIREKIQALDVTIKNGKKLDSIKNPIAFIISIIVLIKDLVRFIKYARIQVIQSHLRRPNQLAVTVGKLTRVSAFPTVHSTMAFVDKRPKWDIRVHIIKLFDEVIYRRAERIIAISQEVKEIIRRQYRINKSKIVVLKNGIVFNDEDVDTDYLDDEFSLSKDILKIFFAGRLSYPKVVDVLIKAANQLKAIGVCDFKVFIAGDGEDRNKLEKMISDLKLENYVVLLGIRHDIIPLMKWSNVYVIPTRFEGLSIAMIEAMACGLPIIASKVPGLSNYIEHNSNGLLFSIEDHNALAKCIIEIKNNGNLRKKLSFNAKATFDKNYNLLNNIKVMEQLINDSIKVS